jgi:hypothetical protein
MVMASFLHRGTSAAKRTGRPRKERVIVRTISRLMAVVLLVLGLSTGKTFRAVSTCAWAPTSRAPTAISSGHQLALARGATFGNATPPGVQKSGARVLRRDRVQPQGRQERRARGSPSRAMANTSIPLIETTCARTTVDPADPPPERHPRGLSVRFVPTGTSGRPSSSWASMPWSTSARSSATSASSPRPAHRPRLVHLGWRGFRLPRGRAPLRVSDDVSVVTEGRYFWSRGHRRRFLPERIDLGGWALTAGVHILLGRSDRSRGVVFGRASAPTRFGPARAFNE